MKRKTKPKRTRKTEQKPIPYSALAVASHRVVKELGVKPKGDRIRDAVISAFKSSRYRGSNAAVILISVVPELAQATGKLARLVHADGSTSDVRPVYEITVRQDWPQRVGKLRLGCVECQFVLDADPVPLDEGCRVAGVEKLWAVVFAVQGHGYALRIEHGLCAEVNGARLVVPYRTKHEAEDSIDVIRRCRRQLAKKARKLRYREWKESKD